MDRELVVRAQQGDQDAFTALVASSSGQLNAVARLILRDPQTADDAVQDALVDAWRGIRGLRDPDRFEPWIRQVLLRSCRDRARRDGRRRIAEIPILPGDGPTVPDGQRQLVITDQVARGLGRLTADQRAVLVLTYYLDLPAAEAAQALGVPVGTLKSRLHRSLEALRAALEADDRGLALSKEWLA
jgi:RNA polymerase sigma-70 factor (ECF subfamily)